MNLIVKDVMTRGVHTIDVGSSVHDAAMRMDEFNVGVLPVTDEEQIVGIVTDRDIVVRGLVRNEAPSGMPLIDVMTSHVRHCYEDQPVSEALQQMRFIQIRRMPVLNRAHRLVGMLALADVATKASGRQAADLLGWISEPAEPDDARSSAEATCTPPAPGPNVDLMLPITALPSCRGRGKCKLRRNADTPPPAIPAGHPLATAPGHYDLDLATGSVRCSRMVQGRPAP